MTDAPVPEPAVHAVCHHLRTMQGQKPADCWKCARSEVIEGDTAQRMCFALAEDVASAALAARQPAAPDIAAIRAEVRAELLNTPELRDFSAAVILEALHQRERWGSEQDAGKTPADWFWLVGYLAGKALNAAITDNKDKAQHHTISTAAALANWHAAMTGADNSMRPGIEAPQEAADALAAALADKSGGAP